MAWHAVPVAIMAGVCVYAAALFIGLHTALARSTDASTRREYLTFALCCLAVAAYDCASVALYDAHSLTQGARAQRCQFLAAAFVGVTYITFTWDFLRRPPPRIVSIGRVLLIVLGLASALWDSPHTLTPSLPSIKHIRFWGQHIVYYECDAGVLVTLLMIEFFAMYGVAVVQLYRDFQGHGGRQRRGRVATLSAMLLSAACAVNDVLIVIGLYQSVYTFEYGIAAILMAMGYVLLMRYGELHEAVNGLNRELSRANAELLVALERANQSVRAKTEFLASISHELRTPLNAIINLPEGLIEQFNDTRLAECSSCATQFELEDDEVVQPDTPCNACAAHGLRLSQRTVFVGNAETAQSCLRTVVRAGRHLLGLVNDVLAASKLELGRAQLQPETVDMSELAHEVIGSAQIVADKKRVKIRLDTEPHKTLAPIVADRIKLAQVLYNLIGNAIKFSPEDSVVDVEIRAPSQARRLMCVRDHGIGIGQEHHQVIFEKFRQVDAGATRPHGGTGLGLSIAKGLVELHGGRIWVESVKGQGAAFFVDLPSVAANDANDARPSPLPAAGGVQ